MSRCYILDLRPGKFFAEKLVSAANRAISRDEPDRSLGYRVDGSTAVGIGSHRGELSSSILTRPNG
jgi:hypothetical protein